MGGLVAVGVDYAAKVLGGAVHLLVLLVCGSCSSR